MYGKTNTGLQRVFNRLLAVGPFILGRYCETIWLAIGICYTFSMWMDVSAGLQTFWLNVMYLLFFFFRGNVILGFCIEITHVNFKLQILCVQYVVIKVTKLLSFIKFLSEKSKKYKSFSMIDKLDYMVARETVTDSNIQNIATDITLHMLHILQQYAKGFISGTNTNRWKQHLLADKKYNDFHSRSLSMLFSLLFSLFNNKINHCKLL